MRHLKRKILVALTMTLLTVIFVVGTVSAQGPGQGWGRAVSNNTPLSEAEVEALNNVLQDEYHAWAVYNQIIEDFGEVSPFVEIRTAEARHAETVKRLFDRYALEIPDNQWEQIDVKFESIEAACEAGVNAETVNAGLYDDALAATKRRDLTNVFTNLKSASLNNHLPALEACDGTPPVGTGTGKGPMNWQRNESSMGVGRYCEDCTLPTDRNFDSMPRRGGRWNRR